jgi:transposase InsO family protein
MIILASLGCSFSGKITNPRDIKRILETGSNWVRIENQKDWKRQWDRVQEFTNRRILEEEGIKHEFSSPYTPQQNGVVERKNRTLLDMARTMLDEYKTPDRFWAEAINTACYSINRLYLHRILKKTSYELLTGKSPMFHILESLGVNALLLLLLLKEVENLNLLLRSRRLFTWIWLKHKGI